MKKIGIHLVAATGRRRKLNDDAVAALAASIGEIGLLNPIVVTPENRLIAGAHRLAAAKRLGWAEIPCTVVAFESPDHERLAIIDENLARQDLTVLERAESLAERKAIYEKIHPEANRPEGGRPKKNVEIISTFAADTAAKAGITPRTVRHEVQLATAIPRDVRDAIRNTGIADSKVDLLTLARLPQQEQKAVAERIKDGSAESVKDAVRTIRSEKARSDNAETMKRETVAPTGKFHCLVIDPPWPMQKIERDCRPNQPQELDYPTMTEAELRAWRLPIEKAHAQAHVWLWTTHRFLPLALDLKWCCAGLDPPGQYHILRPRD